MFAVTIGIQYMFFALLVFAYVFFIYLVKHVELGQEIVVKRNAKNRGNQNTFLFQDIIFPHKTCFPSHNCKTTHLFVVGSMCVRHFHILNEKMMILESK